MAEQPVVVIGAGPAGLATLKALVDRGVPAVCFDAGPRPGGLWLLGGPSSGAYRTLHLNTSKRRTEFADLPMPDEWPDYPSHAHVLDYLTDYATRFDLLRHIHVETTVESVRRAPLGGWAVTVRGPDHRSTFETPAVVVASGHNSVPRWPSPAWPELTAAALHSHDYRDPAQLAGRRVLVVGGGNSAMDIAADASQVASRTVLSLRRGVWIVPKYLFGRPSDTLNGALAKRLPWRLRQTISQTMLRLAVGRLARYGLPTPTHGFLQDHPTLSDVLLSRIGHGEITVRGAISQAAGSRVTFADGRSEEFDLVVWCTGYVVDLPFLDAAVDGRGNGPPLYRNIFSLEEPGLFFVGLMQSTGAALPVVEAQARLVAAFLGGAYALPDPTVQRADRAERLAAARARWGARRPEMRIDFDAYLAMAAQELRAGAVRRQRGEGVWWR